MTGSEAKGIAINPLLHSDLASIVARVGPLWERLRGKRLLITGATGFIGRWMMSSAQVASVHTVVTGVRRTLGAVPESADYILHLAGPPSCHPNNDEVWDAIVNGTKRVCDFAKQCGARLLFASSGAAAANETTYGSAKRTAEQFVSEVGGVNARLWTCYGHGMNLERYALGNFIRDGLAGGPIKITGDGRTRRSFLYAEDMAVALWRLLLDGKSGTYDVGSDQQMSLVQAAYAVASQFDTDTFTMGVIGGVRLLGDVDIYVPETSVEEAVEFGDGLKRTIAWLRERK